MSTSVADVSAYLTKTQGAALKAQAQNPIPSDKSSFTNLMNTTAEKSDDSRNANEPVKQTKTVVEKLGRKDLTEQQTENGRVNETDGNEPFEAVSESITEVKDAILEKFDISEEALESVMETLNISMVDLLDPDALKDLMVALNGQEDVMSALTDEVLYTDMMEITSLATDLTDTIKETFTMSDEDFAKLIDDVRETEIIPQSVTDEDLAAVNDQTEAAEQPKAPEIRVEITRSEDVRTADPISQPVQTEAAPIRQTQETDNEPDNNEAFSQMGQPQQTQTNTHQVGDVVETVRQFSSHVNGQEIVDQVTDYVKVNISPETTSMELQLHPASLGTIHMNIASQNGIVTAQLLVQNESVKAALEAQLATLQETFEEQGTKVEAVEVAVASYDLDRGPFQDRDDRQDRQNADTNRSRRRVNLNLNSPEADELELSEEDQLAKDVMEMNGTSVDFSA
ncbi:MAG: flagellar hook-length control protein FliK [Lachnospiraceae bacterium]|nr:flagellar hook-length control protein FliK [Lachnospiraceae bacterium]